MADAKTWTPRRMLFVGGLALWLGSTLIHTRMGAIVSLWTALLFAGGLLIVTLPTRTLTLTELLRPFCLGGSMIGVAVLAGWGFDLAFGTKETVVRALGIPLVEEALKIAPVLWILRKLGERRWTLGATDVLLLAAAAGIGFYWVEEAFIIHNHQSWSFLGPFPTTDFVSDRHGHRLIAGHAMWTSIAGLTIGLALLLRGSKLQVLLIGASGWLWSALDHGANNYYANYRDVLNRALHAVTGEGYLSLYIFVLGVCGAGGTGFLLCESRVACTGGSAAPGISVVVGRCEASLALPAHAARVRILCGAVQAGKRHCESARGRGCG